MPRYSLYNKIMSGTRSDVTVPGFDYENLKPNPVEPGQDKKHVNSNDQEASKDEDSFTLSNDHYVKLALRLLRDANNQFSVVSAYRGNTSMSEKDKEYLRGLLKELGDLASKI